MQIIHEFSTDTTKILEARRKAAEIANRAIIRIRTERAAKIVAQDLDQKSMEVVKESIR